MAASTKLIDIIDNVNPTPSTITFGDGTAIANAIPKRIQSIIKNTILIIDKMLNSSQLTFR